MKVCSSCESFECHEQKKKGDGSKLEIGRCNRHKNKSCKPLNVGGHFTCFAWSEIRSTKRRIL